MYIVANGSHTSFAYTDFAIAQMLDHRPMEDIPVVIAYDSACSYAVNVVDRFKKHLPETLADVIARTTFTIDALHVQNHTDKCMYLYSASYKEGMGRFSAIGSEQFWAESNQIGPQIRQMNPGHREDKLTIFITDSNWKKTVKLGNSCTNSLCNTYLPLILARSLGRDLSWSCKQYTKKRDDFQKIM